MTVKMRKYEASDTIPAVNIWNQVVEEGVAFPQEDNADRGDRKGVLLRSSLLPVLRMTVKQAKLQDCIFCIPII